MPSSRARAAASSMASGMPSSRRQISATIARRSPRSTAGADRQTERARRTARRPPPARPCVTDRQAAEPIDLFLGRVQRFLAGHQDAQRRVRCAAGRERTRWPRPAGARSCRAPAARSGSAAAQPPFRAPAVITERRTPSAWAMAPATSAPSLSVSQLDPPYALGKSFALRARDRQCKPGLADAAGADDRDQRMSRAAAHRRRERRPRDRRAARGGPADSWAIAAGDVAGGAVGSVGVESRPPAGASDSAVKRYPRPGIVAIACGPSSLRNAEMCTCRLFSSTTTPGQTSSNSSFLLDRALAPLDQRQQHVEGAGAELRGPAADQQLAPREVQACTAETELSRRSVHGPDSRLNRRAPLPAFRTTQVH